jgi:hypothetical protein
MHSDQTDGPDRPEYHVVERLIQTNPAVDDTVEPSLLAEQIHSPTLSARVQRDGERQGRGQVPEGMQQRDESIGADDAAGQAQSPTAGFAKQHGTGDTGPQAMGHRSDQTSHGLGANE